MHATGIICEYNPFHNGHQYHIQKTRELTQCDVLVCVMSGNFVQRGEPAIINKWERTKTALANGCDLVLELPFAFASQSATQFAQGAITTLHLANVQEIVFGSEQNDISALQELADMDSSFFREYMKGGTSTNKAYEAIYGPLHPNDILGINYLRAMKNYPMKAHCIQRTNHYHHQEITSNLASASAIRQAIHEQKDVAHTTCMAPQLDDTYHMEHYYPLIQTLLCTLSPAYLKTLFLMDEGIEHHLIKQAKLYATYEDFLHACTTRRYTTSRIRRTLLHLLNQTLKSDIDTLPPLQHIRILGFNSIGKTYLKELQKQEVPIASRFHQIPIPYRNMELKAARVYGSITNPLEMAKQELQFPIRETS